MLLPIAMEFNKPVAAKRLADVAVAMGVDTEGMDTESAADAAIEAVRKLSFDVGIPATCEGLTEADLDQLASKRCPMSASRETPVTRAMRK